MIVFLVGHHLKKSETACTQKVNKDHVIILAKFRRYEQCLQRTVPNTLRKFPSLIDFQFAYSQHQIELQLLLLLMLLNTQGLSSIISRPF